MPNTAAQNLIPPDAADILLRAHDGDMALLYIYALKHGQISPELAARDLCMTVAQVSAAEEKLRLQGILPGAVQQTSSDAPIKNLVPEDEMPEYSADDIIIRTRDNPGFSAVVQEARKILGHSLSTPDLKKLFGIYDYLALPPEVIMLLLNHCVNISKGRRPSMRYIVTEAYRWANREITTFEQADRYISDYNARHEAMGRIKEILSIRDRDLSSSEAKIVGGWISMGFDDSAIAEAHDRMLTNTGKFSWKYIDKIMQSWHSAGIHTVEEIAQKDPRRTQSKPRAQEQSQPPVSLNDFINSTKNI